MVAGTFSSFTVSEYKPSDSTVFQCLILRLFQRPTGAAAAEGREHRRAHAAVLRLLQEPSAGVLPAAWVCLRVFRVDMVLNLLPVSE